MGAEDMRDKHNVFRMRLSGAEVHGVEAGSKTLKEAINEAMRDWVTTGSPPTTSLDPPSGTLTGWCVISTG